jgi:hypothetical protein
MQALLWRECSRRPMASARKSQGVAGHAAVRQSGVPVRGSVGEKAMPLGLGTSSLNSAAPRRHTSGQPYSIRYSVTARQVQTPSLSCPPAML